MLSAYLVGSPIIYWFFRFVLLSIFTFCGYEITKRDISKFKGYAWIAIISFALIEGLRWLRGVDYYHYYRDIETCFGDVMVCTPKPEFLYNLWVHVFYYTGLPPFIAFIVYSGLLMFGFMLIVYKFKETAVWSLPMFFFLLLGPTENTIRQYIAISFVMIAYYAYLSNKRNLMIVMLIIAPLFHTSTLYTDLLFLIFAYIKIPGEKAFPYLALYILLFFFFDPQWLNGIADYLQSFNIDSDTIKGGGYIEHADRWFTEESDLTGLVGVKESSKIRILFSFLSNSIIIYYGFKVTKGKLQNQIVYFFTYIGILFQTVGGNMELISRFGTLTNWVTPVLIGLICINKKIKKEKLLYFIIIGVFCASYIFSFIKSIFNIPYTGYGFIWDK